MFPAEMVALPQWVVAGGSKVPLNPRTLHAASVTDPRTWGTYTETVAAATRSKLGIGFVLTEKDGLTGLDLDHPDDDIQAARHKKIIDEIDTYTDKPVR